MTFVHTHETFLLYHDCIAIYYSNHYNANITQVKKIQNYQVCETWLFLMDPTCSNTVGTDKKILGNLIFIYTYIYIYIYIFLFLCYAVCVCIIV